MLLALLVSGFALPQVKAESPRAWLVGLSGARCVHRDPWICFTPGETVKLRLDLTSAGLAYVERYGLSLYTLGSGVRATLLGTFSQATGPSGGVSASEEVGFRASLPTTVLLPFGGTPSRPALKIYVGVPGLPAWPRLPRRTALPRANLAAPSGNPFDAGAEARIYDVALERAQRLEGVPTFRLPQNFARLTKGEQLFVLVNLMRVTRGLWPLQALTRPLDRLAVAGARAGRDPVDASAVAWSSNWYSGVSPLAAVYDWMYRDGPGQNGLNIDCPTGRAPGCWGHRKSILSDVGPYGLMGAGFVPPSGGVGGTAALFVRGVVPRPAGIVYTWAQAVSAGARPAH